MQKQSYYLWHNASATQEEYEKEKDHYTKTGFRVVTFIQEKNDCDILEAMKALIQNHISDAESISGKDVTS